METVVNQACFFSKLEVHLNEIEMIKNIKDYYSCFHFLQEKLFI